MPRQCGHLRTETRLIHPQPVFEDDLHSDLVARAAAWKGSTVLGTDGKVSRDEGILATDRRRKTFRESPATLPISLDTDWDALATAPVPTTRPTSPSAFASRRWAIAS
jgi:hypothetical protein